MNNPIFFLARKMWKFSESNRSRVVLYFFLFVAANAVSLLEPLIVAKILNTVQEQGITFANLHTFFILLSLFILQTIAFWIFHGPARVLEECNAFLVRANYKRYLLDGTIGLPLEWHTEHHSGDTIDKIEKGTKALFNFSEHGFRFIETGVRFIGSIIALALFNLNTIFIVLLVTLIAIRIIMRFDKTLVKQYRLLNSAENKISAKIYDVISNISTVIILRVEQLLSKDLWKNIMKPFPLYAGNTKLNEWKWFTASMVSGTMIAFVLGFYGYFALLHGEVILVGTLFALYSYTGRINEIFYNFADLYSDTVRWRTSIQNAEELSDNFRAVEPEGDIVHEWKICNIRSLTFSYHSQDDADLHLDNVSLSIRRGEKIAVIGESGSGKTTFLKIIRGLYTPASVTVSLDGRELPDGFISMKNDIALIPQEPEIFATTIRENITMGVDRTENEIQKYMDIARFSSVVERLPNGLESSVVERGVNLSGGEKQRLALVRGLLASEDKSMILLDESTSSVDAQNEIAIYENIFSTYADKTIIASIHKLHLLRMFDTIYIFDKGIISAFGSFNELLQKSQLFAEMWQKYTQTHEEWQALEA
ncbi:MAG: ABC transporter ATP-binding protein [Candidatus Moranbacteria bacterium]|nr:ABC transporter ATP-binding protein [Candidatus Moranbacteria bacterium]